MNTWTFLKRSGWALILRKNTIGLHLNFQSSLSLLLTADIDREDVCDLVLTEETASDFEFAVDSQVWKNPAIWENDCICYLNPLTLNVKYKVLRPSSFWDVFFPLINPRYWRSVRCLKFLLYFCCFFMSLFAPSMILYHPLAHCLISQRHDNSLLIIISL